MEDFKIYTGYFARAKQYERKGLIPVSIARFSPKWFYSLLEYKDLAPKAEMLKMKEGSYTRKFNEILSKIDPNKVVEELKSISGGHPVVLLCYEKPGDFCHRHLVAEWLAQNTDFEVKEFMGFQKKKTPDGVQGSLF